MLREIDKQILRLLSKKPYRFTDIVKELRINNMRADRRLKALENKHYIFKDEKTGLWRKTNPIDLYKEFPEIAIEDAIEKEYVVFEEAYQQLAKHARSNQYPKLVNLLVQHGFYTAQLSLTSAIVVSAKKQHPESIYEDLKKYMQKHLAYYSTYIAILIKESPRILEKQLNNHTQYNSDVAITALSQFYSTLENATVKGDL